MLVTLFVCLFVCLLAGIHNNCAAIFHKIWWKDGTLAAEKKLDFGGNLDNLGNYVKVGVKVDYSFM